MLMQFAKQYKTIFFKADNLYYNCLADIYLAIHFKGKIYTYNFIMDKSWLPTIKELISLQFSCIILSDNIKA